jgi:phospholipid/cholesterol/gamma-HCH transport system permease protein
MASPPETHDPLVERVEGVGRGTARALDTVGWGASLVGECLRWLVMGRRRRQPVRAAPIFSQMMEVGIGAIPIISMLAVTIGVMLALQGIHTLKSFGAEGQVVLGVALGVTREFAPLITGILVAGRSGSALAARLGTMTINQEIDALRVMGINPVRYLVAPNLLAMVIMVPALALWADFLALLGAAVYVTSDLGMTMQAYFDQTMRALEVDDVMHGISKSAIFGLLITIVGVVDGASVKGGAEGVGKVTTSSVVHAITAIVLTDMLFVFAATR